MPIGKDSITKRVIGTPDAPAPKPVKTTVKKTAPKVEPKFKEGAVPTPTAPKEIKAAEPEKAEPSTAVMGNVSPEVVEKVTGHPEGKGEQHVKITDTMPNYLL